nr:kinetochore protein Nuf2 [Cryptomonas sp.]
MEILPTGKNLKINLNEVLFSFIEESVQNFTGKILEILYHPSLFATECFAYPELHEESICFIVIYRKLQYIMHSAGIDDFSIKDYICPDFKKNRKTFLALNNFAKFREDNILLVNKMCSVLTKIDLDCILTLNELLITKYKIRFIKGKVRFNQKRTIKKEIHKNILSRRYYVNLFLFKQKNTLFNFILKMHCNLSFEKKIILQIKKTQILKNKDLLKNKVKNYEKTIESLLHLYFYVNNRINMSINWLEKLQNCLFFNLKQIIKFIGTAIYYIDLLKALIVQTESNYLSWKGKRINTQINITPYNLERIVVFDYKISLNYIYSFIKKKKTQLSDFIKIMERKVSIKLIKLTFINDQLFFFPFE